VEDPLTRKEPFAMKTTTKTATTSDRAAKRAHNAAQALIDKVYRQRCANIQIDIMDMSKVSAEGHRLLKEGADEAKLADGIAAFVETIRKN
jgi:hypothetical protein